MRRPRSLLAPGLIVIVLMLVLGALDRGSAESDFFSPTCAETGTDVPEGLNAPEGRLSLSIYPNPFTHRSALRCRGSSPGQSLTLSIYDPAGRLVRDLGSRAASSEVEEVSWDRSRGSRV